MHLPLLPLRISKSANTLSILVLTVYSYRFFICELVTVNRYLCVLLKEITLPYSNKGQKIVLLHRFQQFLFLEKGIQQSA